MINKMISINLNQTINKAVLTEMKKEQTRWIIGGGISLLLVISLGLLLTLNGSLSSLIEKREKRINQIITDCFHTDKKKIMCKIQGEKMNEKIINNFINYLIPNILIQFTRR